ncbi:MAG: hypothetical protein ACRDUY_05100 [Nitriliruptorales bacterium]
MTLPDAIHEQLRALDDDTLHGLQLDLARALGDLDPLTPPDVEAIAWRLAFEPVADELYRRERLVTVVEDLAFHGGHDVFIDHDAVNRVRPYYTKNGCWDDDDEPPPWQAGPHESLTAAFAAAAADHLEDSGLDRYRRPRVYSEVLDHREVEAAWSTFVAANRIERREGLAS